MQRTVLIYEDNSVLRESIELLIDSADQYLLLASFGNALHAEEQVRKLDPDVIIMDIDLPGLSGIEAVQRIRRFNANAHIIMLTVFEESETVLKAICSGASGYLLKKHLTDRLLTSINEVLEGGAPMSPGIAKLVISSMHAQPGVENKYGLSSREKEILGELSKGSSYKIIAEKVFISIDTVRTHIKNIYKKLQVHSQTEAVSKAINEKLF